MTKREMLLCNGIIHTASLSAGAIGGINLPIGDDVIITPIQVGMVVALGNVFGIDVDSSRAKAVAASSITSLLGKKAAKALVTRIPIYGNIINCSTAAGLTEVAGWKIAKEFENLATIGMNSV